MSPAVRRILCHAALGRARLCVIEPLTLLGQGEPWRALDTLFDAHPASKFCGFATRVEDAIDVLNLVMVAVSRDGRLAVEQRADLAGFIIQRLKLST